MEMITPLKRTRLADERRPSGTDVARAVGIDPTFYFRLEQGERAASAELADQIAKYFRVDKNDLFKPTRYESEPEAA